MITGRLPMRVRLPAWVVEAALNAVTVPQTVSPTRVVRARNSPAAFCSPLRHEMAPTAIGGGGLGSDPAASRNVVVPSWIEPVAVAVGAVNAFTLPHGNTGGAA